MRHHLAILTDFPEEGWRSMDLCGDMLLDHLPRDGPFSVEAARLCPPFGRIAGRLPAVGRRRATLNADRLLNRFILFPRYARQAVRRFDLFHIADHSYGQLVHALPAARTEVYCHDVDAFRCLFDTVAYPRPRWFRAMSQRILTGLRKAAVVFHSTAAVGEEISTPTGWSTLPMECHPNSLPTRPILPWSCRGGRGPHPPVRKSACLGHPRSGTLSWPVLRRTDHRAAPRSRTQTRPDTSRNFSEDRYGI